MTVDKFHQEYERKRIWETTTWLGVPAWKLPFDAWVMQEIIFMVKPDLIIETGTGHGGSALFYASVLELIGKGIVITVDKENKIPEFQSHSVRRLWRDRVLFRQADSLEVFAEIKRGIRMEPADEAVIVILDSWHTKEHVLKEMEIYGSIVTKDSYLIVEDTHSNGHPVEWEWGEGPMEAVCEFLKAHSEYEIDHWPERLGMTFNPNGYLRRVR